MENKLTGEYKTDSLSVISELCTSDSLTWVIILLNKSIVSRSQAKVPKAAAGEVIYFNRDEAEHLILGLLSTSANDDALLSKVINEAQAIKKKREEEKSERERLLAWKQEILTGHK